MYAVHGDTKEHSGKKTFSKVEHIILTYIHHFVVKVFIWNPLACLGIEGFMEWL